MEQDLRSYSPITLAFLGDAVYSLYVRSALVAEGNAHAKELHKRASGIVSAMAQAKAYDDLENGDRLTEEERDVMRRGRNAHVSHQAKNATNIDYHKATGFEALLGYLYLAGRTGRLEEIINGYMRAE